MKHMNATQNLLMLMQQMSSAMSLPNVNSKPNQGSVSFEDMLNQASSAAPKDKAPVKDDSQSADAPEKPEAPKDSEAADQTTENGEEKTAYQLVGSAVNPYANLVQPDVQPAEDELVAFDPQAMTQVQSAPLVEDAPAGNTEPQVVDGSLQVPEETVETVEEAPEIAPETVQKAVEEQPEVEIRTVKAEDTQAPAEDGDDTHVEGYEAESTEKPLFKDAEAAPIKVGERYEVDTESTDMDNQLANSIRQAMSAAVEKVEIRLAPEHLGAVTIEMGRDANGALQVVLYTATGKAANLLTEHLDSLHAALQNMGHDAVHVEVQRNEESAQQQSMHQQADPDGHNQQKHPQQQRQQQSTNPEDFMQQLRLGLFSLEDMV